MRHALLLLLALFGCVQPAAAQLVWDQKEQKIHVTASDPKAFGHFKYKNAGNYPIRILAVVTSCGCTIAKFTKDPLPPGATGEITGIFDIGGQRGYNPRTLTVETDDQKAGTKTVLYMITTISDLLRFHPSFLEWKRNEPPVTKTIDVEILDEYPVTDLKVTSTTPAFGARVETVTPGKAYRVFVSPGGTAAANKTLIVLSPEYVSDHPRQFFAHVRVK